MLWTKVFNQTISISKQKQNLLIKQLIDKLINGQQAVVYSFCFKAKLVLLIVLSTDFIESLPCGWDFLFCCVFYNNEQFLWKEFKCYYWFYFSVFTWHHGSHISVLKQWIDSHVGFTKPILGGLSSFLISTLSFVSVNIQ